MNAPSSPWSRLARLYQKAFSIAEIETSRVLQWLMGACLLTFFVTFNSWSRSSSFTIETVAKGHHSCWPFFQNCGDYYFLSTLPHGYSQGTVYALLFGLMLWAGWELLQKNWGRAHLLLMLLLAWKILVTLLSNGFTGNYDYFHTAVSIPFLFFPHKLFFSRLAMLVFYLCAGSIKIHEGWLLGTYFSAMKTGIPLLPEALTPLWTNLVIGLETIGIWFLMSSNKRLQRLALLAFILFHLYSGILVGYRYPTTVMPTLLILFGPLFVPDQVPLQRSALWGWSFIILILGLQLIPWLIPGEDKFTREAGKIGLYMFDANHQYISYTKVFYTSGKAAKERVYQSHSARERCDPYRLWFRLKKKYCEANADIQKIEWKLDHSINGGPFYRIVDTPDACALEFIPFTHNSWIKRPEVDAPIVGRPLQNVYD